MLTKEQQEELERLKNDPQVKAVRKVVYKTDPEKKRLYQLRWLKKKAAQLFDNERKVTDNAETSANPSG